MNSWKTKVVGAVASPIHQPTNLAPSIAVFCSYFFFILLVRDFLLIKHQDGIGQTKKKRTPLLKFAAAYG
jgi:hypothetical protein